MVKATKVGRYDRKGPKKAVEPVKAESRTPAKFSRRTAAPREAAAESRTSAKTSPASGVVLAEKYLRLCQKYQELVVKFADANTERMGAAKLSWWAMRSSASALCMIRDGAIVITNNRFNELERAIDRKRQWRPEPRPGAVPSRRDRPRHANLRALVETESRRLVEDRLAVADRYFHRVGHDQVIKVRLERVDDPSPAVLVLAFDVTDQAKAERELARAHETMIQHERMRAVGELASGIAHDLNNTLNALMFRIETLKADRACMLAQGKTVDAAARILRDWAAMVARLQDFARKPERNVAGSCDLSEVIQSAVEMAQTELRHRAARLGVQIDVVCDVPKLPPVVGAAAELRSVFINLLLNARDAMPKGGGIHIAAREADGRAILTVQDEGTGIPDEHLERIFDPFFTTKGKQGTGLGLSMAYAVLGRMGGRISAANGTRGGAVFTIELPLAESASFAAALTEPGSATMSGGVLTGAVKPRVEAASARSTATAGSIPLPRQVLVVDDDQDNLAATKQLIELQGRTVDVADSGTDAVGRMRSGARYEMVLCDVGMPKMDGWQVAREIRSIAPETPVYLVTGWAREIPETDPRRALVRGVLKKPVDVSQVKGLLDEAR